VNRRRPSPPPRSARRLGWRAAELVALDFETTGLDPTRDDVISFGLVPISGGRIDLTGARYQEVVPRVEPRESSIRVHHLRMQDLARAPALTEVLNVFRTGLSARFILAWAAAVEVAFLRGIFGGRERTWRRRVIDVRTLIMALERSDVGRGETDPGRYALGAVAERFGVPVEETHHALDDAFMTAELFLIAAARYEAQARGSVADLARIDVR
jgi:DNA polymerase-3 subunit epsilon